MNRILATVAAIGLLLVSAPVVLGHTGSISGQSDCSGGTVTVFLDNNVTADRLVTVTSTIPGSTGLTGHYTTTGNSGPVSIWTFSGPQPFAGTVTLTIGSDFTASKTIEAIPPCPTPSHEPTPTPTVTPCPDCVVSSQAIIPSGTPHSTPHSSHAVTLPPTDTIGTASDSDPDVLPILAIFAVIGIGILFTLPRRHRR